MTREYKQILCKLNGKQSISIPVDIKKNGEYITETVDLIVKGMLKFSSSSSSTSTSQLNTLQDKTIVYPVLFTSDRISVSNGRCIITLLPRSEDLFEDTTSISSRTQISVSDSSIKTNSGISADEQITNPDRDPVTIKIQTGVPRYPYKISLEVTVFYTDGSIYSQTVDRGSDPQVDDIGDVASLFKKQKKREPSNLVIDCYNDEDWVPSVDAHLSGNDTDKDSFIEVLDNLNHSTPFGLSTMYDAIYVAAETLSDNSINDIKKITYVFTDNEANTSIHTIDETIDKVNAIDGYQEVPLVIGNINIFQPETLSVKANRSDTRNINRLSYLTGGQSVTVNSEDYLEDVIAIFYGETVGSLGYGTYEFTVDLLEESLINQISAFFDVPVDTGNATWSIETSTDGYTFTVINRVYNYDDTITIDNLYARYIKFKIILITGFASSPYIGEPLSPTLTGVQIIYNKANVKYLYLNVVEGEEKPYHITLAVDANEVNDEQIRIGVATSDSYSWDDYHTDCKPSVNQNGKVVVPIRFSQDTAVFQQEPLNKIDRFLLKAEHGSWDPYSTIVLYDKDDEVISTNNYSVDARNGMVILNFALPSTYADGDYKIGVINEDKYKIGLKLTNKSNTTSLDIYGIGYVYTSGKDLLPPVSKAVPEAQSVEITNESPNRLSKIAASYVYYDSNYDEENTEMRKIKWYINGTPIKYLENLEEWNDIENPKDPFYMNTSLTYPSTEELNGETLDVWAKKQTDSILKANDVIYCEVQVSDGNLYSLWSKSNSVTVLESSPVMGGISIKGYDVINNRIQSRITPEGKIVFDPPIDQVFYSDGGVNTSDITWYVNGEIFKTGRYGDPPAPDHSVIHEIGPGEYGKTSTTVNYKLNIGDQISARITPRTGTTVGEPVDISFETIKNSLPRIENLSWVDIGSIHSVSGDAILAWKFFDYEIALLTDTDTTFQFDQTTIKVYRKNSGTNRQFELIYIYNDHSKTPSVKETFLDSEYAGGIVAKFSLGAVGSTLTIRKEKLSVGQKWYVEVVPHDSLEYGETAVSRTLEMK